MPRLTLDQWQSIRAEREAGASFGELAEKYNVDKAAIIRRAKREEWGDGQDVADIVRRKAHEKVTGIVTIGDPKKRADEIKAAAEKVAAVVAQHQREWQEHRARFGSVPDHFEDGKLAKISAEMLAIRQKGERAAHGLDEPERAKPQGGGFDLGKFFSDLLRKPAAEDQPV